MRALLLALLCFSAHAEDWTPTQKALSGAFMTAWVVDWAQTRNLVTVQSAAWASRSPYAPWYEEKNPILGPTPTRGRVNAYFIAAPLVGALVLDQMPSRYRTPALAVLTALELGTVGRNFHIGLKASF